MISKHENGFDKINISNRLDKVVEDAIKRAKKAKKKNIMKLRLIKSMTAIASIFIIFVVSVNCIPVFAQCVNNIPVLSTIARAIQINYSNNIGGAFNESTSTDAQQNKMANNIKINITNVVSDNKNLYISYTLDGKKDKQGLKNILVNDLQITDIENNILIDTKFISMVLPNTAQGKQGDLLFPEDSYGYHCTIASLGNSLKSYSENQQTTGLIQLSADNGKSIPDKMKLTILGFTEAYDTSYSMKSYNDFISKFNRKPINLDVNCSFDINVSKKLSLLKPESYNDIKFIADNTDFEIKYFNIYPTYIEAKVQLGKNKLDNYQCYSIISKVGTDLSGLPYLMDENGNKYMPYVSNVEFDSNNCQTITFESSYFNQTKELYFVVNQLTFENGFHKLTPVKVKIK